MYTMNQITIIGFTGSDVEAHYTQNGAGVFLSGSKSEFARTLMKGSHVMVQGAVRTRAYEGDGVKHRVVEVRADTVGKLDRAERRTEIEAEPDAADA